MGDLAVSFAEKGAAFLAWFSNPLTQMLLWPLIGCLLVSLTPRTNLRRIRVLAVLFCTLSFIVSVLLLSGLPESLRASVPFLAQFQPFAPSLGMQFVLPPESYPWFAIVFGEAQSLSVNWAVGVDGISLPLVLLTTSIMLLACLWSLRRTERIREYFALFLLLECGLLGIFVALDYVLFYLFWELMLIPMYFLIAGWGKRPAQAQRAAIKFFIFTVAGSVFYLISFIAMQIFSNRLDFNLFLISQRFMSGEMDYLQFNVKLLMFIGLMLAFAVKIPLFPFHTWLADAHTEAPTELSVILAAVMLKTGAYGMIRIVYSALPDVAYQLGPLIAALGVIGIVYGAALTLVQTDLKRMIAYSSISHMGFIVLGISALNFDGLVGSLFHMVGHGVIIAALFFLAGVIEERYGTRDLRELAGLLRLAPSYGIALAIAGFAAMGFPLMMGFWGEFLVLKGAIFNNPNWEQVRVLGTDGSTFLQWCAIVSVLGILTSAVYIINMLTKVLTGDYRMPVLVDVGATRASPEFGGAGDSPAVFVGVAPAVGQTLLSATVDEQNGSQTGVSAPPIDGTIAIESTPAPPTDAAGHVLTPWRGMQPLHAMALLPLLTAMLLFFWWPGPILNLVQIPASGLYAVWLGR